MWPLLRGVLLGVVVRVLQLLLTRIPQTTFLSRLYTWCLVKWRANYGRATPTTRRRNKKGLPSRFKREQEHYQQFIMEIMHMQDHLEWEIHLVELQIYVLEYIAQQE